MSKVKYPQVNVSLIGHDGNAFSIMGRVMRAMKDAKIPNDAIKAFQDEAMNGDYDHLLQTVMATVNVE